MKPSKITIKGDAYGAVTRDALWAPLTLIFHGLIGAYREDGKNWITTPEPSGVTFR